MFPLTILNQTLHPQNKGAAKLKTLSAELGWFSPELRCPWEALQGSGQYGSLCVALPSRDASGNAAKGFQRQSGTF